MRTLINNVLNWGQEKGLLNSEDATRQYIKGVSEMGELGDAIIKGDVDNQLMEMGDVLVTLILTAAVLDMDIEEALAAAYAKISKRTGTTVDGVFIKAA